MNLNREEFIKPNITDYFNYIKDQPLQNEEAPNWEKKYVTDVISVSIQNE